MAEYLLSPEAQQSLKQIKNFSIKNFGKKRTKTYLEDILTRFRELAANPSLGKIRDELKVGYYSFFICSHTIYYRTNPDFIEIIDVLHQSMEPARRLNKYTRRACK